MGLNEVFKKVADIESNSTELASQKVDLATLDQLLTSYVNATKKEKESSDAFLILKTDVARAKQKIQDNLLISERTIQEFNQFEKDAKSLGLALPQDVQKNLDTLKKGVANYNRYLKSINSIKF
jgi:hypothetical protein